MTLSLSAGGISTLYAVVWMKKPADCCGEFHNTVMCQLFNQWLDIGCKVSACVNDPVAVLLVESP